MPAASHIRLKPLAREGLVAIDVDPQDRRNRLIRLTPEGTAKLKQSDVFWEAAQSGFEKGFGGSRSTALREAMELLIWAALQKILRQP